jgi:hypothetical protein
MQGLYGNQVEKPPLAGLSGDFVSDGQGAMPHCIPNFTFGAGCILG